MIPKTCLYDLHVFTCVNASSGAMAMSYVCTKNLITLTYVLLTHWGRDKMVAISQTTLSKASS